jgi:hypothetical protein
VHGLELRRSTSRSLPCYMRRLWCVGVFRFGSKTWANLSLTGWTYLTDLVSACDDGFYLEGIICAANTCTCSSGTVATGADCTIDQAEICTACEAGLRRLGDQGGF